MKEYLLFGDVHGDFKVFLMILSCILQKNSYKKIVSFVEENDKQCLFDIKTLREMNLKISSFQTMHVFTGDVIDSMRQGNGDLKGNIHGYEFAETNIILILQHLKITYPNNFILITVRAL